VKHHLTWPLYSFRAETVTEVVAFLQGLLANESQFRVQYWTTTQYGEPYVELTTPLTLPALRGLMASVADSHVMRDTLRVGPLAENTLERT